MAWPAPVLGRVRACALVLALLSSAGAGAARAEANSLEFSVKATFLYKFGPFVEWPPQAFDSPASPFVLCVQGDDPFGASLDRAIAGQHVGQHPVVVRRLAKVEKGCHVLYAAGSKAQSVAQALAAVRGAPVLTVTDESSGDGTRGVIDFVVKDSRVRFQIDAQAAAQNGLSVSSKLLSLAINVRPAPEAGS